MQNSDENVNISQSSTSSSSSLYEILCTVCQAPCTGMNYGVYTCKACADFYYRYSDLRNDNPYQCDGQIPDACVVDIRNRNKCTSCRLKKCFNVGMQRKHHKQDVIICEVCQDRCIGMNYGVHTCRACAAFFQRYSGLRNDNPYTCEAQVPDKCVIDIRNHNQCISCRLKKCFDVGMQRKKHCPQVIMRCEVCQEPCTGMCYGVYACKGCAEFFRHNFHFRSNNPYQCKSKIPSTCVVNRRNRNECQPCRLKKCFDVGMQRKHHTQDVIRCEVCNKSNAGRHFGVYACTACKCFFERYMLSGKVYACTGIMSDKCVIDSTSHRKCPSCRLKKCFEVGMKVKDKSMTIQFNSVDFKSLDSQNGAQEHNTFQTLVLSPIAPQMVAIESIQVAGAWNLSCNINWVQSTLDFEELHEHDKLHGPALPYTALQTATIESIQDTAVGHLFNDIQCMKDTRSFDPLSVQDQIHLFESSSKDIFILSLAQHMMPLNVSQLLSSYERENKNANKVVFATVAREAKAFQNVLNILFYLVLDAKEYNYLRMITLLRPPSANNSESSIVGVLERMYNQAKTMLQSYIRLMYPNDNSRYTTIMEIAAHMNSVSNLTIDELFSHKVEGATKTTLSLCVTYWNQLVG